MDQQATEQLYEISRREDEDTFDIREVERLVAGGADVTYRDPSERFSSTTLVYFAMGCQVDAILSCLKSTRDLNFALSTPCDNFLCRICNNGFAVTETVQILHAVLAHLRTHPGDMIDWGVTSFGNEFIAVAAGAQLLSTLYPLLRDVPYFSESVVPISLKTVWRWDWEALSAEDKNRFSIDDAEMIEVSQPTAQIFRLAQQKSRIPAIQEVEGLLADGADIHWKLLAHHYPALISFAIKHTQAALLCLGVTKQIDFTVRGGGFDRTVLHLLCFMDKRKGTEMLEAITRRVESHPRDLIQWDTKDKLGKDFICYAAQEGCLSLFYPIVRDLAYFADKTVPIKLEEVQPDDWAALSEEDKKNFAIKYVYKF